MSRQIMSDSTIISALLFLFVLVLISVFGAEANITELENKIDELYGQQQDQIIRYEQANLARMDEMEQRIAKAEEWNRQQNFRLTLHRQQLDDQAAMFTDLLESTERLEEYMRSLPDNVLGLEISSEDEYMIASLVYLESGSGSYQLQKAIASVIFNRMMRYGLTARQAVYQPGVFSPAGRVAYTRPSATSQMAVREVLETGCTVPRSVVAFQLGGYHSFGRPYTKIQNVYFTAM